MLFKVIILFCAANISVQDCTPITASNVIRLQEKYHGLAACMREGQIAAMQNQYFDIGKNYPKIVCDGRQ